MAKNRRKLLIKKPLKLHRHFRTTIGLLLPVVLCASACSVGSNQINAPIRFVVNTDTSWWVQKTNSRAISDYQNLFNQTFLKIKKSDNKYQNVNDIDFKIDNVGDSQVRLQNLISEKTDFSFLSMATISSQLAQMHQATFDPYIQTLTRSFVYDYQKNEPTRFSDDQGVGLEAIAKKATEAAFSDNFNGASNVVYTKLTDNDWDGAKYPKYYNKPKETVKYYRGMILISGTDTELKKIREAWNKKTPEGFLEFAKFGIIHGRPTSAGSYLLPQALIRKHFNLGNNWSLLTSGIDRSKLQKSSGSEIGQDPKFKIAFDDEGSWAWQKNDSSKNNNNLPNLFNPVTKGAKIEVLSVTDPLYYDYGVFSNKHRNNLLLKELILRTFRALSNETTENSIKDGLGFYSGYNDYVAAEPYRDLIAIYNRSIN